MFTTPGKKPNFRAEQQKMPFRDKHPSLFCCYDNGKKAVGFDTCMETIPTTSSSRVATRSQ